MSEILDFREFFEDIQEKLAIDEKLIDIAKKNHLDFIHTQRSSTVLPIMNGIRSFLVE